MNEFLMINKAYMGLGLKSIDLLLISQIEEFQRNKRKCFLTNEQFSFMFGESVSKIKRTLDKLEDLKIVKRETTFVNGNGRANKKRVLIINNPKEWKVHSELTIQWKVHNEPTITPMEGSKVPQWKVHSEPIKDNLKDYLSIEGDSSREIDFTESYRIEKEKKNRVEKKDLQDLSIEELKSLLDDYKARVHYIDLYNKYNLKGYVIDITLPKRINEQIKIKENQLKQKEAEEKLLNSDCWKYNNWTNNTYSKKDIEDIPFWVTEDMW